MSTDSAGNQKPEVWTCSQCGKKVPGAVGITSGGPPMVKFRVFSYERNVEETHHRPDALAICCPNCTAICCADCFAGPAVPSSEQQKAPQCPRCKLEFGNHDTKGLHADARPSAVIQWPETHRELAKEKETHLGKEILFGRSGRRDVFVVIPGTPRWIAVLTFPLKVIGTITQPFAGYLGCLLVGFGVLGVIFLAFFAVSLFSGKPDLNLLSAPAIAVGALLALWAVNFIHAAPDIIKRRLRIAHAKDVVCAYSTLSGKEVWRKSCSGSVEDVALTDNGELVVVSSKAVALLRANDGCDIWYNIEVRHPRSTKVSAGRLFLGTMSGLLLELDGQTGRSVWSTSVEGDIVQLDIVENRLYALAARGSLYCLDTTEKRLLWRIAVPERTLCMTANRDHLLFVGEDDHVFCVDPLTGNVRWTCHLGGLEKRKLPRGGSDIRWNGTMLLGSGCVYVACRSGLWRLSVDSPVSPVRMLPEPTFFAAREEGSVASASLKGELVLWGEGPQPEVLGRARLGGAMGLSGSAPPPRFVSMVERDIVVARQDGSLLHFRPK